MIRKLRIIFLIIQIIGVGIALYSSQFEVGTGGFGEYLWIAAEVLLFPGALVVGAVGSLDLGTKLVLGYTVPFFIGTVLVNGIFWAAIEWVVRRKITRLAG